jgi:hypothetical protein
VTGQSVDRSDNGGDSGDAAPEVTGQSVDRSDNGCDSGVAAPEVTGQSVDNGGDSGDAAPEVTGQSVDRSDNGGDSGVAAPGQSVDRSDNGGGVWLACGYGAGTLTLRLPPSGYRGFAWFETSILSRHRCRDTLQIVATICTAGCTRQATQPPHTPRSQRTAGGGAPRGHRVGR